MKLRTIALVLSVALVSAAAHAQTGVYLTGDAQQFTQKGVDYTLTSPSSKNIDKLWLYGAAYGVYYDFFHSGPLTAGFDVRESDLHANNAMLRSFLVGARVSAKPFTRPIKPYAQFSLGLGTTKPPVGTVHVSKFDYVLYGGVDYTLQKHIDFRVMEIGYGSLTTVSTATVGGGGTQYIPASTQISFSSGLVFRF